MGLSHYFTGKPCVRGHISRRIVSVKGCEACQHARYLENAEAVKRRAKLWKEANRDRVRECTRLKRASDPEAARAKEAAYRPAYKEKTRVRVRAWRDENIDRYRAYQADWKSKNRTVVAGYSQHRRALQLSVESTLTPEEVTEVTRLQNGKCAYCRSASKLTIDHIIALSKGGTNTRRNIQMLCKSCNSRKHVSDPIDFAQRQGFLL